MENIYRATGLTSMEVSQWIKKLKELERTRDFNSLPFASRKGIRRACIHLNHVASGLRMDETGKDESVQDIYLKLK